MANPTSYGANTIAKLLKITPRRLHQLVQEGVIPKRERGRYELVPVVHAYIEYLRDRAINADASNMDDAHKIRLVRARADIAEMEADRLREELIPQTEIEQTWGGLVTTVRRRLLTISTRAAPLCASENETPKCKEIIDAQIRDALEEISSAAVKEIAVKPKSLPVAFADNETDSADDAPAAKSDRRRVGRPRKTPQPRGKRGAGKMGDDTG